VKYEVDEESELKSVVDSASYIIQPGVKVDGRMPCPELADV